MVLVIDNYDSFTYNLVQYLGELGAEVRVMRNDRCTVNDVVGAKPDRIVIDSNPTAEYEETRDKARALLKALELAQQGL